MREIEVYVEPLGMMGNSYANHKDIVIKDLTSRW